MASNKVEMSLDDIIKQNKKTNATKGTTKRVSNRKGKFNNRTSLPLAKKNRIIKKRVIGNNMKRQGKKMSNLNNQRNRAGTMKKMTTIKGQKNRSKQVLSKGSTTNLVKQLVKKALAQVGAVKRRNTFRTRIANKAAKMGMLKRQVPTLNRLNQRSRTIVRRPRIVALPIMTQPGPSNGRGFRKQRIQYLPVISTVPTSVFQQRNFGAFRQQGRQQRNFGAFRQQGRFNKTIRPSRFQTVREQISQLRQSGQRQSGQRQFGQRFQQRNPRQRRPLRQNQRKQQNPFDQPPNFLQRF